MGGRYVGLAVLSAGLTLALSAVGSAAENVKLARGIQQVEQGDLAEAVETLTGVVRTLSSAGAESADVVATAHLYLGIAYILLDQEKAGRASFREAVTRRPQLSLPEQAAAARVVRAFREVKEEVSKTATPPSPSVDLSEYDRMQQRADQAAAMEKAWKAVQGLATTESIPIAERVAAIKKFQADFPAPNGHSADADRLIQHLQNSSSPPPVATLETAARDLYTEAYAQYARGNYAVAIETYETFRRKYPDSQFADNAQYWIGESLYSLGRYDEAIERWNQLFRGYPSSDKIPDAHLKKGLALERLGRRSEALAEYRLVADRYPNSAAARQALERLR